jgi:hypothetical protein
MSVGFFAAAVLLASLLDAVTGALVLIAGISWLVHTHERTQYETPSTETPNVQTPNVQTPDFVVKSSTVHEEVEVVQPDDSDRYTHLASTMHISTVANSSFSNTVTEIVPHGELPPWFPFE